MVDETRVQISLPFDSVRDESIYFEIGDERKWGLTPTDGVRIQNCNARCNAKTYARAFLHMTKTVNPLTYNCGSEPNYMARTWLIPEMPSNISL